MKKIIQNTGNQKPIKPIRGGGQTNISFYIVWGIRWKISTSMTKNFQVLE
jgi:hypothetical protein